MWGVDEHWVSEWVGLGMGFCGRLLWCGCWFLGCEGNRGGIGGGKVKIFAEVMGVRGGKVREDLGWGGLD